MQGVTKRQGIIFYNRGGSGQGKTTSLRELANLIARKYPSEINNDQNIVAVNIRDIRCIREIAGVKIGILTQGDPGTKVEEELAELQAYGCEIFACCTRTDGKTRNEVLHFASENKMPAVEWRNLRSKDNTLHAALNHFSAELFLATIEAHIAHKLLGG